jgi:hypothetical protein
MHICNHQTIIGKIMFIEMEEIRTLQIISYNLYGNNVERTKICSKTAQLVSSFLVGVK